MMLFGAILIWAVFELSQKEDVSPRIHTPKEASGYLLKAAELFLVLIVLKACSQRVPGSFAKAEEFFPLLGVLLAYGYCRLRRKNEIYGLLAFACALQFHTFQKLGILALGVYSFVWLAEGLRFRALFSPTPRFLQGVPSFWIQIFLTVLAFSCFFPF